jgi:hypothetical protein
VGVANESGGLLARPSEPFLSDLFGNAKNESNSSPRVSISTRNIYPMKDVQLGDLQLPNGGPDEG